MPETPPEITCDTCTAACCKAPMRVMISRTEHKKFGESMGVEVILKPSSVVQRVSSPIGEDDLVIPEDYGWYRLKGPCGNLNEENRCTIYTKRPQCCRDFEMGSPACRHARREAGLDADLPVEEEVLKPAPSPAERLANEIFGTTGDREKSNVVVMQRGVQLDPLNLAEVRTTVERDMRWIAEQLASCDAPTWLRRTRCAEWNVGDLVAHIVTDLQQARTLLRAAVDRKGATLPDEFTGDRNTTIAEFRRAATDVGDALVRLPPGGMARDIVVGPGEAVNIQGFLQVLTMELAVHSLDLAHALGETRHLAADATRAIAHVLPEQLEPGPPPPKGSSYVLRSLAFQVPFNWRKGAWQYEFGEDPCYIEGEPEAVLLFALGREAFDESRLSTNRPDRARAFKRHLRGP